MLNGSRTINFSQGNGFAGLNANVWIHFPPLPEVACGIVGIGHIGFVGIFRICHSGFTLFTGKVFRTYGPCLCIG